MTAQKEPYSKYALCLKQINMLFLKKIKFMGECPLIKHLINNKVCIV